jgi:hypothetical protein
VEQHPGRRAARDGDARTAARLPWCSARK